MLQADERSARSDDRMPVVRPARAGHQPPGPGGAQVLFCGARPGTQVSQGTTGSLDNGGETVTLLDANSNEIDRVTYDDDTVIWPGAPDGTGPSLSLLATNLDNSLAASWTPSAAANGTPGAVNFP